MSKTVYHILLFLSSIFLLHFYPGDSLDPPSLCSEYDCGNGVKINYPFWSTDNVTDYRYCGFPQFGLSCYNQEPVLSIDDRDFLVKSIDYTNSTVTLVDKDVAGNACPRARHNISLGNYPLDYTDLNMNISFYFNCSSNPFSSYATTEISCLAFGTLQSHAISAENSTEDVVWDGKCEANVVVPVMREAEIVGNGLVAEFGAALNRGFELDWMTAEACRGCEQSKGFCGYDETAAEYICYCRGGSISNHCNGSGQNLRIKIMVAMGVVIPLLGCTLIVLVIRKRQLFRSPRNNNDFEAFLEKHGPLAVRRYSYSQVKKMINSFAEKLGQGGYGTVYKGTLLDGRLVAVKILNLSKGEGKEFLNEVATISRTSHVNIVTLLGFCLEGEKRALVYEFMPNGSLDKLVSHSTNLNLGWESVHQIVIGIAQGLEYLHRGCNTRIVHFDIKPHNVLLDQNFVPKISDFGLAKLCTKKESVVSMLEARGTIGYIAPEVFSRNFGQVSSKSDVYSYGMMILEIVGARRKDIQQVEGNNSSETYFPNWIYKSLELETEDDNILEEDAKIIRKLKLVGLWCIQVYPSERPTMSKVIDMLQANQTINIPPKPFLSSSSSSQFPLYSSTASSD